MKYLLDTNICIYLIKHDPPSVRKHFQRLVPGDVGISSITLAELEYGAAKSRHPEKNREALAQFVLPLEVLPFDAEAALTYGQIRADLEVRGAPIGSMDLLIAAHALALDVALVTNNLREFRRVRKLQMENWV
jgi:tRNA(fMet)-specific endonuclease VapC